jgi:hypothetical protein
MSRSRDRFRVSAAQTNDPLPWATRADRTRLTALPKPSFPEGNEIFFLLPFGHLYFSAVTVETFQAELAEAMRTFQKYVVCLDKTPDECAAALGSLMEKAIKAYQNRGPNLRHGIALDKQITIILSQTDGERPLCGIYFNLSSPYQKKAGQKTGSPEKPEK